MGKISLRAYNHEIENLIERGHTEEAIAHCKYILKTFPKHLDTYRLLGKTYLESQRYSEAADILQRILSVLPDDFVAQIGMSIIREDENNLDAAIYHMERAFEIQPSNAAIQDELRRLYGRRDGVEPPKLRLTRGALVRMYARGDLYRQAIAEARAAINEDPQRLDLEIVLAQMYYKTGKKAEAAEICSRLVTKLPYCLEANRILAEVLPETSRANDAKVYQQRLNALDPYQAYLTGPSQNVQQVQDQAVALDELEWTPSLEADQQPAWAQSLGVELDQQPTETVPEWLEDLPSGSGPSREKPTESTPAPFIEEAEVIESQHEGLQQEESAQPQEENLPEWMQASGWSISGKPAEEAPADLYGEPEGTEAAPGEIPAWLKDLAPSSEVESPAPAGEEEGADWLSSFMPKEQPQEQEPAEPPAPAEEMGETKPTGFHATEAGIDEEQPEWLKSLQSAPEDTPYADQSQEPLPDWLTEVSDLRSQEPEEPSPKTAPEQEIAAPQDEAQPIAQADEVEEAREVLPEAQITESQSAADLESVDEAMAWLEGLAAKQGADEETLLTPAEDRIETPPEWVSEATQQAREEEVSPVEPATEAKEEPVVSAEETSEEPQAGGEISTPSAEVEIGQLEEQETPPAEEAEETTAGLQDLSVESKFEPVAESPVAEPPRAIDEIGVEEQPEEPLTQEPGGEMDMDSAFAWLESLAAKQGADEESLLVQPENRQETPPDWIQKEAVQEEPTQAEGEFVAAQPAPEEKLPEWMKPPTETEAPPPAEPQPVDEVLPDWLKIPEEPQTVSAEELPSSAELEPASAQVDQTAPEIEETPLVTSEAESTPPEEETLEPVAALPSEEITSDWVQGVEIEESPVERSETIEAPTEGESVEPLAPVTEPPAPSEPETVSGLPDWLTGIPSSTESDTQPTTVEANAPEEEPLPEWLKSDTLAAVEAPVGTPEPVMQAVEETPPLPDWLKDLEAEQEVEPLPVEPTFEETAPVTPEQVEISNDPEEMVFQAQAALQKGQIDLALVVYDRLVQQDQKVEETIHDLRDALYRFPVESAIWQTLGDAYMRVNQVQDALDAYTKAEELLK